MQISIRKNAKTAIMAILVAAVMLTSQIMMGADTASAKTNGDVPDLKQSTSTLTLRVNYNDDDKSTPIDGVTLAAYKVANVKVADGYAKYTATKAFDGEGFDFQNMSASDSMVIAEKAHDVVKRDGLSGKSVTSNGSGVASFGEIDNGIYMLVQTSASGSAKKYGRLTPWLIELPELSESASGAKSWNYGVVAYPKPLIGSEAGETPKQETPPETPEEELEGGSKESKPKYRTDNEEEEELSGGSKEQAPKNDTNNEEPGGKTKEKTPLFERLVKTGDENNIMLFGGVAVIALGLLLLLIIKKKNSK